MRLIDADAQIGKFDERYVTAFVQERTRENKEYWNGYCTGVNWGRNTFADAPTVDAALVVRCKDCAYWDYQGVGSSSLKRFGGCKKWYPCGNEQHSCYEDDFCSCGVKREEV